MIHIHIASHRERMTPTYDRTMLSKAHFSLLDRIDDSQQHMLFGERSSAEETRDSSQSWEQHRRQNNFSPLHSSIARYQSDSSGLVGWHNISTTPRSRFSIHRAHLNRWTARCARDRLSHLAAYFIIRLDPALLFSVLAKTEQ